LTWQSKGSSADEVTVVTHTLAPGRGGWQQDADWPGPPGWPPSGSFKWLDLVAHTRGFPPTPSLGHGDT